MILWMDPPSSPSLLVLGLSRCGSIWPGSVQSHKTELREEALKFTAVPARGDITLRAPPTIVFVDVQCSSNSARPINKKKAVSSLIFVCFLTMNDGLLLQPQDNPRSNACSDGYSDRTAPFVLSDRRALDNNEDKGDDVRVALVPNKAHAGHEESAEHLGEDEDTASLLGGGRGATHCPTCFRFLRTYRSGNPQSRVTPVAIVILIVLFIVYVLNQADKLVLAVLIPAGLRCEAGAASACPNTTSNVTVNSTAANSYYSFLYSGDGNYSMSNDTSVLPIDCIHFSDDEQGIMTGPAFTVVYVIAGLPLARLADTRSRSLILLLGLAFWSVVMLLMGFVNKFWQLLLLRILLGIGEVRGRGQ